MTTPAKKLEPKVFTSMHQVWAFTNPENVRLKKLGKETPEQAGKRIADQALRKVFNKK